MKRLWLLIVPLLILALLVGVTACAGGGPPTATASPTPTGTRIEPTAAPATPTPTATRLPSTAAPATPTPQVTRPAATASPAAIPLPRIEDTTNLTTLMRSTAEKQGFSGYALLEAVQAAPKVSGVKATVPFDDSYDLAAMVLSLTPAALEEFGITLGSQFTHAFPTPTPGFPPGAPQPYYDIRVHVILCANDDGSGGAADPNAMTADYFAQIIAATNLIFDDAGIRLVYDPATDFEKRNSTLLNLDFTIPATTNYWLPATLPPLSDLEVAELSKPHADERQRVGREYRGKMVLLLCDGNMLVYDSKLLRWKVISRDHAFSGEDAEFVALPTGQGDVQGWANLLGHESGHYYHQWHTHWGIGLSAGEANDPNLSSAAKADILKERTADRIREYVNEGHSWADGLTALDGDISQVADTPGDPGPDLFHWVNGDECGPVGTVDVAITSLDTVKTYTVQPDRADVVSYFKHCTNIPQHFSPEQIAGIRKSLEQENRWHLIGTPMRLKILNTYVLNGELRYNAVWRPSNEGEIRVYGWTRDDFGTKYNELSNQGMRLHILDTYVLNGELRYNAVWRPSNENEVLIYGWTRDDFGTKYDQLW